MRNYTKKVTYKESKRKKIKIREYNEIENRINQTKTYFAERFLNDKKPTEENREDTFSVSEINAT